MQDPLATVDSLFLDIPGSNLRSPSPRSQYAAAAAAAAAASGDWTEESFADNGIRMVFQNGSLRHRFRNSDDQLDILGQFEFVGDHSEQQLRQWNDGGLLYTSEGQGTSLAIPEEGRNPIGHEPWNHLQTFVGSEPQRTRLLQTDGDFSDVSGVLSTTETLAWPANSPPESNQPFLCGDIGGDCGYDDAAEPYNGADVANIQYSPNDGLVGSPQDGTFDLAARGPAEHPFPNFYQHVGGLYGTNEGNYQLLNHHVDEPATCLYSGMEPHFSYKAWNYLQDISPLLTSATVSSPNEDNSLHQCWDEAASCHHDDSSPGYAGIAHLQPGIIKIEGNSERFQPELASSFPPTAGFFPDYWSGRMIDESRNVDEPRSRPFAWRPASRNSRVNRKLSVSATMPTLSVIHEDGKGGVALSTLHTMKGRRVGPLSKSKAAQAAKNRKEKCVCIRCKMMKQSCSGEVPCRGCKENIGAKIWKSPCVKAEFLDMIEAGTCNYICKMCHVNYYGRFGSRIVAQRSINHLTLDQSRRVTMLIPETFNLAELLDLLKPRLSRFNIHARQLSGSLYTLDLAKCYEFLSEIYKGHQSEATFQLRDFIDNKLLKASTWLTCVKEPCSIDESLGLLAKWNNMPSRASYDIVSLTEEVSSRPMNVENSEDQTEILIAAQLSRIICRALEVAAFKYLHKELNRYTKGSKSNDQAEKFVRDLGQLLLTLRWRISWWEILGDGSAIRDDSRDRYIDRVQTLTRVLYFYYCNAKKKLPSFLDPHSLKGVQSCYADAEPIFDEFPHEDSIEGFHKWMKHGRELIHEAGVQRRLSRY